MSEDAQRPRRRWTMEVHVQADEWDRIVGELERLARHVAEHGPACDLVSGGPDVGSHVQIVEVPDMTHDRYFQELEAYLTYLDRARAVGAT